jgi:hypothetical protein
MLKDIGKKAIIVIPDIQRSASQTSSASARRLRQTTVMNGAGFVAYDLNGSIVFQIFIT